MTPEFMTKLTQLTGLSPVNVTCELMYLGSGWTYCVRLRYESRKSSRSRWISNDVSGIGDTLEEATEAFLGALLTRRETEIEETKGLNS